MKNIGLILLSFFLVTVYPATAQIIDENFCKKYPLNSNCKAEEFESIENSKDEINNNNSEIIDELTLEEVKRQLQELGYVNINPYRERSFQVVMQGKNCLVYVSSNGRGMSITSSFPTSTKVSLEDLNEWNKSLRYAYAYEYSTKDKMDLIVLESSIIVSGGVAKERIKSFFQLYPLHQNRFNQFLNDLSQ